MNGINARGRFASAAVAFLFCAIFLAPPAAGEKYRRQTADYAVPDATLLNQRGEKVRLPDLLRSDRPVLLDFVYATCTTICPVMSAGFANFQRRLGAEAEGVRLVSITIDPEHDTPEVMAGYLERYGAQPGWDFLTGNRRDIDAVMRAFDAYAGNKMSHLPLTFLRNPGTGSWVRLDGLMGTSDLIAEYRALAEK